MDAHRISLLGAGFIGRFYAATLHHGRGRDRIHTVFSRSEDRARTLAVTFGLRRWTTDMRDAVEDPDTDLVVVGLPNDLHAQAVLAAAAAGKAVLCTKPLGRSAAEARRMLDAVAKAGVFSGYLEDLVYPPKTTKALQSVGEGALGQVLWVRSRETHPGPHSDWFWDLERAGGGALIDMGCHCVEIIRSFVGKQNRPVEAMCWVDTLVHPVRAEDHAIALIRFESGAVGQVEVGWAFRGGMDLRDEVAGTHGTIWLNHWLRTGFEMFTAAGTGGYVAEKAEADTGWLFPVGDEAGELGYTEMFCDMFAALDEGREPRETFWDGLVVNAVIDTCYRSARSKRWEPIAIDGWRATATPRVADAIPRRRVGALEVIKEEVMPDGKTKRLLHDPVTGRVTQEVV